MSEVDQGLAAAQNETNFLLGNLQRRFGGGNVRPGFDGSVSLPRGEEQTRRPRVSGDPVSACRKGKALGGAGECSSEERARPRKLERGPGRCH